MKSDHHLTADPLQTVLECLDDEGGVKPLLHHHLAAAAAGSLPAHGSLVAGIWRVKSHLHHQSNLLSSSPIDEEFVNKQDC